MMKSTFITGASAGIGKATALLLQRKDGLSALQLLNTPTHDTLRKILRKYQDEK